MTFLKKLGQIGVAIGKYIPVVGPIVTMVAGSIEALDPSHATQIQQGVDTFTRVVGLVITAESMGQAAGIPGPQRATAIANLAAQEIVQSAFFFGKKIADPVKFQADAGRLAGVVADLLNDLHEDAVSTVVKDVPGQ